MYTQEKPGTPEEILEHHGVKGMRWGVRSRTTRQFRKDNPTMYDRKQTILEARTKVRSNSRSVTNADRAMARRFTAGEKTALTILAVSGVLTLPIAAYAGYTVAERRSIEKRKRP